MWPVDSLSLSESFECFVVPCLCDILTGFGLVCLLQLSAISPDASNLPLVMAGAVLQAVATVYFGPCQRPMPPLLSLLNTTFSLTVTLSLLLNLLAQLCPPLGTQLALIPVFFMLCICRSVPSSLGLVVQCMLTLALALPFLLLPLFEQAASGERVSARPGGTTPLPLPVMVQVGTSTLLASLSGTFDTTDASVLLRNRPRGGGLQAASVLFKGAILLCFARSRYTPLYHYMFEAPPTPLPPKAFTVFYGLLLLFASMQTASKWYEELRSVLHLCGGASARALVRLQHILNALLLAAAWAFPLQLHLFRCILTALLLAGNAAWRWTTAVAARLPPPVDPGAAAYSPRGARRRELHIRHENLRTSMQHMQP